jgi:uncharacterized protein (TIGR00369 family)
VSKKVRMSTRRELAHNFAVAIEAGDWERANELVPQTAPLHKQLELRFLGREGNTLSATMELSESVRGFGEGTVHGGILATFADVVSGFALVGTYGAGAELPVTTDMHTRYYRQPRSGPLEAEATVVHRGRRLLSTECVIADGDNRILARSSATYAVVPLPD